LHRAVKVNKLKPAIDKTFGFTELREAITYLKSGRHFGKVVVEVAPTPRKT